jgi:Zn-dependent protease
MKNKVELKSFQDIESANEIVSFLEENNIEYLIEKKKNGYNLVMTTDILESQIILWVSEQDYNAIISQGRIKEILTNDVPEHYLYTFSDEDILEAINNPDDYTEDEIQLASKIASDRGLGTSNKPTEISLENIEKENSERLKSEYPPKPLEEIKSNSLKSSLISLGLFIGAFYLIFKWDFNYILVLAGVILIHELGHFLAMRIFKYSDLGIFFVPLVGAFASGRKDTISQKQNVTILLSGPLPGIVIGLILYYYGLRDNNEFLLRTSNIFIFLNLFNLIPIMPLDGGRVIRSMFFENNELINKMFLFLSIAILTMYSLYSHSYFLLIIPFFLLTQLSSQHQVNKVKEGIRQKSIDFDKTYDKLTNEEYWLIRDEIGTHMKYFNRFITPKRYIVAEDEQRIIKQVKAIVQKKPIKDLKVLGKILITLLWVLTFIVPFVLIAIYYIRLGIKIQ